jgi:hypothetical protein
MSDKLKIHPGGVGVHPHYVGNVAGQTDQTNVHADLGKAPRTKRAFTEPLEIHNGSNAKSRSGTHFAGLSGQDLSRYDADGPDPLAGPAQGKRLAPVQPSPGMRSRTNDPVGGGVCVDGRNPAHDAAMLGRNDFTKGMQNLSKRVLDEAADAADRQTRSALGIGTLPGAVTED